MAFYIHRKEKTMTIGKELAMKLWNDIYGDKRFVQDWNVDHIRPKASYSDENEADDYNNFELMHRQNNLQKSDNYPHFEVNGKQYHVVKNNNGGYGIADSNGNRIDWKKDGRHYR